MSCESVVTALAVDGLQEVIGGKHQEAGFGLCLRRKRNMDSHLVAVEVGVERACRPADEALMALPSTRIRLKCLNTKSVQGRRTVEQHGMLLDDVFKRVPNLRALRVRRIFLRVFDIVATCLSATSSLHDEGLEQLKRHFLGQTALINFELGSDDDNGTAGIVNTLTEQVLTETSLLTAAASRKEI